MKLFEYVAVGPGGEHLHGHATSSDEDSLDHQLLERGLVLTRAKEVSSKNGGGATRLSRSQVLHMTHQLAFLVKAGVPLVQGLVGVAERMPAGGPRELVREMADRIQSGGTLSEAMDANPKAFPRILRSSIAAGEASGALDTVLVRVAKHLAWSGGVRATTLQALVYPTILFGAIIGLIGILLWFLLPRILSILPTDSMVLPLPTRIVKGISDWGITHAPLLVAASVLSICAVVVARRSRGGRHLLDSFLLRLPGFGPLVRKIATTKFAATTSVLHQAGCDAYGTLDIASRTAGNRVLEQSYLRAAEGVRAGEMLSDALGKEPHVDPLLIQMVAVGEGTGDLCSALDNLVQFYDEEVPREVKRFLSILEPSLLIFAGAVVAFVLLAAILPMFEVYGSL